MREKAQERNKLIKEYDKVRHPFNFKKIRSVLLNKPVA